MGDVIYGIDIFIEPSFIFICVSWYEKNKKHILSLIIVSRYKVVLLIVNKNKNWVINVYNEIPWHCNNVISDKDQCFCDLFNYSTRKVHL